MRGQAQDTNPAQTIYSDENECTVELAFSMGNCLATAHHVSLYALSKRVRGFWVTQEYELVSHTIERS
jgi:hypothetical protein